MEDKLALMRKAMEIAEQAIDSEGFTEEMINALYGIKAREVYIREILSFITYEHNLKYPSEDDSMIET